jgi:hypothetical protein
MVHLSRRAAQTGEAKASVTTPYACRVNGGRPDRDNGACDASQTSEPGPDDILAPDTSPKPVVRPTGLRLRPPDRTQARPAVARRRSRRGLRTVSN